MKNFRNNKNYKYFDNNIEKTTLKNGFKIITKHNPFYNSFAMGVFVNVGSRDDFHNKSGLAHLLEHILFKKTKKNNYKQIAEKFEEFGAYYNAFTTQENLSFYIRALAPHYKKSLNILFEIIRAAFSQRRKTLRNALSSKFDLSLIDCALKKANINPNRRGETLSINEFALLCENLA